MAGSTKPVQELYIAYFGRPADVAGLEFWSGMLNAERATIPQIALAFASSAEYKETYSGSSSPFIVASVYQQLFGHAPDPGGAEYWNALLQQGAIGIDNVVTAIAGGARGTDLFAFQAKVSAAAAFTAALDTPAETLAYVESTHGIVSAYIARVMDAATLAAAIEPKALAALIDSFGDNFNPSLPPVGASAGAAIELIGLAGPGSVGTLS